MITYSNIRRYDDLPFDEYLNIPGYSHSFLKSEKNGVAPVLNITDNIMLGALVDAILTDPRKASMSHPLYPAARRIAATLKQQFGDMIRLFKKQPSFVAKMEYAGFHMTTKGRLDFLLEAYAVIDLKVTMSKQISSLIGFMGYENQVWHYAKLAGVPKGYLMIYSVPLDRTFIVQPKVNENDNAFWKDKILKFGKVNSNEHATS